MAEDFERVTLCKDGKYRWVYEKSLYRDLSVLFLIIKIFAAISLVMAVLFLIIDRNVVAAAEVACGMILLMTALSVAGYFLYAAIMGGSYCVSFTMDEKGVTHQQHEKQVKKAKVISELCIIAGVLSKSPGVAGTGMMIRTRMYSDFRRVRSLEMVRKRNTIHVDGNEVYAPDEDLDKVWDFIREHCPKAEVKE